MSQRKNSVQLSKTAWARLQTLVDSGQFESVDDAANFVIVQLFNPQVLSSTTPVLTSSHQIETQKYPIQPQPTTQNGSTQENGSKNALAMLKQAQSENEVQ